VKSDAETKLNALKEAIKSGTAEDIKAKQADLQQVFEKLYQAAAAAQQQAGAQSAPNAGPAAGGAEGGKKPDDGVVDADFKEV
jgi:molecular chaperone DnaK